MDKRPENRKLTELEIKKFETSNRVLLGTFIASSIVGKIMLDQPNKYMIWVIVLLPLMGILFAIYYGYFKK